MFDASNLEHRPFCHDGQWILCPQSFGCSERVWHLWVVSYIKKRRYWPKYVDGDGIDMHFVGKAVGECDALKGNLDGVDCYVFGMKEPDYIHTFCTYVKSMYTMY